MDLRLSKNAVFFKDTFCLSKKSAQMGKKLANIAIVYVYVHEDPHQNLCLLQYLWKCDGFESKYCCELLAKIASTKVLIFVLALAVASATRKWDL